MDNPGRPNDATNKVEDETKLIMQNDENVAAPEAA